jgi:hypothetical protein
MFGWEIGFGVAVLVGAISLFIGGQIIWGAICIIIAAVLAIDSLRRIYKVTLNTSDFRVLYLYREDRSNFPKPHEYHFAGEIEIKVPSEVNIKKFYLELLLNNREMQAALKYDSDTLKMGSILAPSKPLFERVTFQLSSDTVIEVIPESAIIVLETTGWKKRKTVALVMRDQT